MSMKYTPDIIQAFLKGEKTKTVNNTYTDGKTLYYHGNMIATKKENEIYITNAGWPTKTTKERLNMMPNVSITQKNFKWYLNEKEWNGELIKISK